LRGDEAIQRLQNDQHCGCNGRLDCFAHTYCPLDQLTLAITNHHFKWWFDIGPIRAMVLARLKGGRHLPMFLALPLKKTQTAFLFAISLLFDILHTASSVVISAIATC